MKTISASLLFVLGTSFVSSAAEPIGRLVGLCHRHSIPDKTLGQVGVKLVTLSPVIRSIPVTGLTLPDALGQEDQLSVLASQVSNFDPKTLKPAGSHLYADSNTPETLVIQRGFQIFVFPRLFLFHPAAQQLQMKDGDVVLSLFSENYRKNDDGLKMPATPTASFLPAKAEHSPARRAISGAILGPLYPSDRSNSWSAPAFNPGDPVDSAAVAVQIDSDDLQGPNVPSIEKAIRKRFDTGLDAQVAVFVLRRRAGGRILTFISPLKESGLFRQTGPTMVALANSNNPRSAVVSVAEAQLNGLSLWELLIGQKFYNVRLIDGDSIELTTLENVEPFRQLVILR
jgi:hypothetical protein